MQARLTQHFGILLKENITNNLFYKNHWLTGSPVGNTLKSDWLRNGLTGSQTG